MFLIITFRNNSFIKFNPIQDEHFWGGSRMGMGPFCHIYSTMMKPGTVILYLGKIQKTHPAKQITRHIPLVLLTSAFFHRKSENFATSRNKDIDWILIHNF